MRGLEECLGLQGIHRICATACVPAILPCPIPTIPNTILFPYHVLPDNLSCEGGFLKAVSFSVVMSKLQCHVVI